ncbi:MAG: hypothetical protein LBJ00_11785 [Planctomycetaceae bacterium]|nr:hypothetical protein [Planctomycetaceae bacterium]
MKRLFEGEAYRLCRCRYKTSLRYIVAGIVLAIITAGVFENYEVYCSRYFEQVLPIAVAF